MSTPTPSLPSGPVDPALTVLSVQSTEGRPIAVLANYSQHYFGARPSRPITTAGSPRLWPAGSARSRGVSPLRRHHVAGNQRRPDVDGLRRPRNDPGLDRYADEVADSAYQAYKAIATYHDHVPLAMAETTLTLRRRVPDEARLKWARGHRRQDGRSRLPATCRRSMPRRPSTCMSEPERELKLQAIRIGELGITAIPNEVLRPHRAEDQGPSPLPLTMNIELANGSEGYIPPPEQHVLGGYTTWPARTAALEVQAEPKIVAAVLGPAGTGRGPAAPRRSAPEPDALRRARPGRRGRSPTGGSTRWRDRPPSTPPAASTMRSSRRASPSTCRARICPASSGQRRINRAVHLAGGRLVPARLAPGGILQRRALVLERLAERCAAGHRLPVRPVRRWRAAETLGLGGSSGAPRGGSSCPRAARHRSSRARPRSAPGPGTTSCSPAPAGESPCISTATRFPRSPATSRRSGSRAQSHDHRRSRRP